MPPCPPAAAMERLAAALGDDADRAAGHASELRLEVGGQHADFGHRIHIRIEVRGPVRAGVEIDDAVHREVGAAGAAAVNVDAANRAFAGCFARARADHAGNQVEHRHQVAALNRDLRKLVAVNQRRLLAGGGLYGGSRGDNRNLFGNRAKAQLDFPQVARFRRGQVNVLLCVGFESLRFCRQEVRSRRNVVEAEDSFVRGGEFVDCSRRDIPDLDVDARDAGIARIHHGPHDVAGNLPKSASHQERQYGQHH